METTVEFYDLKTRAKIAIGQSKVTKTTTSRQTKTGTQTRYSLKATAPEGTKLTKFVKKADYDALDVPIV